MLNCSLGEDPNVRISGSIPELVFDRSPKVSKHRDESEITKQLKQVDTQAVKARKLFVYNDSDSDNN